MKRSAVTNGVVLRPAVTQVISGTGTFTGTSDSTAVDLDVFVGADGILRLEFAQSFEDNPNAADATFTAGSITFNYEPAASAVPEPAIWGTMILDFGMIGAASRRRKTKTTVTFA